MMADAGPGDSCGNRTRRLSSSEPGITGSGSAPGPFGDGPDRGRSAGRDPGSAASRPAFQWLRDGADIPGAVGALYVPGPEDDLRLVSCRVTVGTGTAVTPARRVTRAAPEVRGGLREEGLGAAGADWAVGTAGTFSGEDLLFSVAGDGARIDPRGGVLTLGTGRARAGEIVTVRAENSGGAAETAFIVTVEAGRRPRPRRPPRGSSSIPTPAATGRAARPRILSARFPRRSSPARGSSCAGARPAAIRS